MGLDIEVQPSALCGYLQNYDRARLRIEYSMLTQRYRPPPDTVVKLSNKIVVNTQMA
jgi:hypothetical protein